MDRDIANTLIEKLWALQTALGKVGCELQEIELMIADQCVDHGE